MRGLLATVRAVVAYPSIIVITLILGFVAIIGARLPRRWHVSDLAARIWAWLFLKLAGLHYHV
ncbi:MAG: hypothetical protein V3U47_08635, partial [Acidimicrobiia bacterium]